MPEPAPKEEPRQPEPPSKRTLQDRISELFTFNRIVIGIAALPFLFYVYREAYREALVIEPLAMPKPLEESGLTSEVMANRIGDALYAIESKTKTRMKKDKLDGDSDTAPPDVEVPGTGLGVKTLIDVTRTVFGIYPRRVIGDVVMQGESAKDASEKPQATLTFHINHGRDRTDAFSVGPSDDVNVLAEQAAEKILEQLNPYVLAAYLYRHAGSKDDYKRIEGLCERSERGAREKRNSALQCASLNLWGVALDGEGNLEGAISKYQEVIHIDPKHAATYDNLGNVLADQGKTEEAIRQYQKAIEFDPKIGEPYLNWGIELQRQNKSSEAADKFQRATEIDPSLSHAYQFWGECLTDQGRADEAAKVFQKAREAEASNE